MAHYIPDHRFKLITISLVGIALIVGILIPSIELVIGLIGSTIGVAICIMFPASCFIKVCQKNSTEKLLAQFLLIFGFLLMVLGTYANLNAIDEKNSGTLGETEGILKHVDVSLNLSKQLPETSVQVEHLVTTPKFESDLKLLPDPFDTLPKSLDKADETKYHENAVDGLDIVKLEDVAPPKVSDDDEVKQIPLLVETDPKPNAQPDDAKRISSDINKEAIQKEDQEIAIEKKEKSADDSQSELKRLEEEVKEIKNVLKKQNQETQQLRLLQKIDEIADKVEKIEKVQEEDNKKHEEEKIEHNLLNERKNDADSVAVTSAPGKSNPNISVPNAVTNQTGNDPVIGMLMKKQMNRAESVRNLSQDTNVESKINKVSKEEVEHAPILRDLLNVNPTEESTDQSVIDMSETITANDSLREKRDVNGENCPKPGTTGEGSKLPLPENENDLLPDVKLDVGRDLKSVQDET